MKNLLLIILILSFPIIGLSQHITVSPYSIKGNIHISVGYNQFSLHYFKQLNQGHRYNSEGENAGLETPSAIGISVVPIDLNYIKIGGIFLNKGFPTRKSLNILFVVDVGINFKNMRVSYTHLSNGFELFYKPNPSYDAISFTYNF